ncbi:MAG: hypothetical protein CMD08_02010 [Flavobacteriales bacterium]|nr:hypothetical protein [Flavobacteriales bacterium]|tara:strand:+ start:523 stop:885 length:363 start_codon:yes stop_codon:yes gene_type:complete
MTEDQQRLSEIINDINDLMGEAIELIPENMVERAKSYWYAHIMCAVSDDHEFLGGSMHHMQDCLDEWMEQEEEDSDRIRTWMSQEDEDDYIANNPLPNDEDTDLRHEDNFYNLMRDEDRD